MSDNLLDQVADDTRLDAASTVAAVSSTDPEVAARRQRAAAILGLPSGAVDDTKEAERRIAVQQANAALGAAPTTTSWLVQPQNAAVAHDSVPSLAKIETLFGRAITTNPVNAGMGVLDWLHKRVNPQSQPGDFTRRAVAGIGVPLRGFGEIMDTLIKLQEGPQERAAEAELGDQGPMPGRVFARGAAPLIAAGQGVHSDIGTEIAGYVPSVAASLISPALGAAAFAGQGADAVAQDAEAKGAGDTQGADTATLANATLQGALGLVGIKLPGAGLILPKIASPAARALAHLGLAATENAATGAVMQGGQNLIAKSTFDPNQDLGEGVADSAGQMAIFGTLFHAAHLLPGAMREVAEAGSARAAANATIPFDEAVREAQAHPLAARSPDHFDDLMSHIAGGQNVYVPADAVREFMQAKMSPQEQAQFADATGIADQIPTSVGPGADIAFPADKYLSVVSQIPGAHEAFADHLRMAPDAMSAAEARAFDEHFQAFLEERGQQLAAQGEVVNAAMAPAHAVYQDVFSQAREAGYTIDAADQYAALYAARYEARGARLGTDALTEFQRAGEGRGVAIQRELPPELVSRFDRLDPVIDALRKGVAKPNEGPSLLDFLSRKGGVKDDGGELSRLDAQTWHTQKPFRSRLVREDGMSLATATEKAQDAGYLGHGGEDVQGERLEPSDLMAAIQRELRGEKVLAAAPDERGADFQRAVAGLDEVLGRLGVDPKSASNAEIKAAVKAYQAEHAGERTFGQAAPRSFKEQLDRFYRGLLTPLETLGLGRTPLVLKRLGAPDLPLRMAQSIARKITGAKHDIERVVIERLPELLANPAAVFRSATADHSLVAIVEFTRDNKPIVAAVHLGEGDGYNAIKSVHVKDRPEWVAQQIGAGNLLYLDEKRVSNWADVSGVQFPGWNPAGDGRNVLTKEAFVNQLRAGRRLEQDERGNITFGDGPAIIRLFQGRDLSTLLHETGHLWLEELRADAALPDAPEQIKADWATTEAWLGTAAGEIETAHHEQFARGFEAYLMDGRAPSEGLRGVFQKFRSWLVNIYRNVAGLNVDVSPEMRGVFDRLVATEDEISAAAKRESLNPIFLAPEDGNMTTAEWTAYTRAVNASNEAARDHLMARLMRDVRRTRTKEWVSERAGVREDMAASVDTRPDVKAYHYLTRGELLGVPDSEQPGGHKLDRKAVVMTYGTDAVLDRLPRGSTVETGGVHPDDIAELTGHSSGEAMMNAVMGLEDARRTRKVPPRGVRKMLTDAATDEEMVSRHGDALRDGSIEEEAADALHNDERMQQVSLEVAALGKVNEEKPWSREILQRYAEDTINAKKLSDLRPDAFLRAERQAGNEAQRLLMAGDKVTALERKRQQLMNMHLYRAAKDALDAVTKAQTLFDRLAKTKTLSTMAQGYLDQIHGLLQRYGYRVPQTNLAADFEVWKAEREAAGDPVIDTTPAIRPLKDLTVEEIAGLKDTVDNLAHVGRREKELIVAGRRERLSELADEVVGRVLHSKVRAKIDTRGVIPSNWGAQARASLMKMETIADMMDLNDGTGPFNRVLVNGASDANARENALQHQSLDALRQHYDAIPYENRRTWRRLVEHTLVDPRNGQPMKLTKANVVAMALNMGAAENFVKLTDGYGWEPQIVHGLVMRTLDAHDWKFVQGTWDTINALWPDIVKTERALTGVAPKKVFASPLETPHGTLAGGYYPIKYDAQRSRIVRENEDRNLEGAFGHKLTGAATRTGFTKERTRFTAPVSLSPERVIFGHMRDVVKRIAWGEWFLDAQRFLKNDTVAKAVEARLGTDFHDALIKLTRTSIGYNLLDERALGWLERALRTWRVNGVSNIAGFNPRILLEHTAAHAQSIAVLGKAAWAKGVADYASDPIGKAQFVFDRSPEMVARKDQANQNIADLMADIAEHRDPVINLAERLGVRPSTVELARQIPHMPISAVNLRAVALPTWLGGYHKALGEGLGEREAIRAGDKAVRVSHASGAPKDLALAQQGNEFYRLFTTFFSYHLNQWNLYERGVEGVRQSTSTKDYARSVESMIWALPIAAIVGGLAAGQGPKHLGDAVEDAEWAVDRTIRALWEGVPLARNIGSGALDILEGKGTGAALDDAFNTPALRGVRTTAQAAVDLTRMVRQAVGDPNAKPPSERWMEHLLEAPGYFFGLPMLTPARTAEYVKETAQGTQQPQNAADVAAGLAFGPPPSR